MYKPLTRKTTNETAEAMNEWENSSLGFIEDTHQEDNQWDSRPGEEDQELLLQKQNVHSYRQPVIKTYVLPTCHVHTEKHIYTMYTQNEEHSVYLKKNQQIFIQV